MNDSTNAPAPSSEPTDPSTVVTVELTLAEIEMLLSLRSASVLAGEDRINFRTARAQLNDAYHSATGEDSQELQR